MSDSEGEEGLLSRPRRATIETPTKSVRHKKWLERIVLDETHQVHRSEKSGQTYSSTRHIIPDPNEYSKELSPQEVKRHARKKADELYEDPLDEAHYEAAAVTDQEQVDVMRFVETELMPTLAQKEAAAAAHHKKLPPATPAKLLEIDLSQDERDKNHRRLHHSLQRGAVETALWSDPELYIGKQIASRIRNLRLVQEARIALQPKQQIPYARRRSFSLAQMQEYLLESGLFILRYHVYRALGLLRIVCKFKEVKEEEESFAITRAAFGDRIAEDKLGVFVEECITTNLFLRVETTFSTDDPKEVVDNKALRYRFGCYFYTID